MKWCFKYSDPVLQILFQVESHLYNRVYYFAEREMIARKEKKRNEEKLILELMLEYGHALSKNFSEFIQKRFLISFDNSKSSIVITFHVLFLPILDSPFVSRSSKNDRRYFVFPWQSIVRILHILDIRFDYKCSNNADHIIPDSNARIPTC